MVNVRGNTSFTFSTIFEKKEDIPVDLQKRMEGKLVEMFKAIENPNKILEEAVLHCFRLFEIPDKDFKKFTSEDGEVEFRNKSRILNISYKKVRENKNFKSIKEKVSNPNKIHCYEIDWVIFNVNWDRWSEKLRKIYAFIINRSTSRIPGLGILLGDFINKKIKETGDQWIVKSIELEFNEIFYSILKSNHAIEYIKYNDKKLLKLNFNYEDI